jgi:hypothetical protein
MYFTTHIVQTRIKDFFTGPLSSLNRTDVNTKDRRGEGGGGGEGEGEGEGGEGGGGMTSVKRRVHGAPPLRFSPPTGAACSQRLKSNELTRGTTELVHHFRVIGGVPIGVRALLDINLIWFGYIARLSQWEGRGCFTSFK